jgi:hypothetical protein
MGVLDGQDVDAAVTNPAFINKNLDDVMPNKLGFSRISSGASISDIQAAVNRLYTASGATDSGTTGTGYVAPASTITVGDPYVTALSKLAQKFDPVTGHTHSGSPGDGPPISPSGLPTITLTGDVTGAATGGLIPTILSASIGGAKTFTTSLSSPAFISTAAPNPAVSGEFRATSGGSINWRSTDNTHDLALMIGNLAPGEDVWVFAGNGTGPYSGAIFLDWPVATLNNRGIIYAGLHLGGDQIGNGNVVVNGVSYNANFFASNGEPTNVAVAAFEFSNDSFSSGVIFGKGRGTAAVPTTVVNGDTIGSIGAVGYDGIDFKQAAQIVFKVGAAPASGSSMPGSMVFMVTKSGSVSPTTALTISPTLGATFTGTINDQAAASAGSAVVGITGTPFSGGTSTTTKPMFIIQNAATSNNWSTSGTILGLNPATGWAGNLIDAQIEAVSKFKVSAAGVITTPNGTVPAITPSAHGVLISGSGAGANVTTPGASGQVLTSNGAGADPTFQSVAGGTVIAPTHQEFLSGSGTYVTPTSPAPLYIRVRMVGGGGGGGCSGTSSPGAAATVGGDTTFGSGDAGGGAAGAYGSDGAAGGSTGSLPAGWKGIAVNGGRGTGAQYQPAAISVGLNGGTGGGDGCGGGGGPGTGIGLNGQTNTGGGGGGAAILSAGSGNSGSGGGGGAKIDAIIVSPATGYSYSVGAKGTGQGAGTGGYKGGDGGTGGIWVDEFYQ